MLTLEGFNRHQEEAARQLKALSYEELASLADALRKDPDTLSRFQQ
jgi:hypothetical protein